jgi:hypothetical protein
VELHLVRFDSGEDLALSITSKGLPR